MFKRVGFEAVDETTMWPSFDHRCRVEVDRSDSEFAEELASARRVAIAFTFDADDREYTDVRGPDGE